MEDERVTVLEEVVAKLQARDIETQTKLDLLLASVAKLAQPNETMLKLSVPAQQDIPPPPKTRSVRPATPTDFDGNHTN